MATIQDYLEAAKGAIISGSCDRAIALCRHVLQHFPKHVEAHCLLAEAYREQGDGSVAEDILIRVLSADPENLIARWALSSIYDERGERDAALGHLRIALEVRPDHSELRKEIVQLSNAKAKPTLGGLARLYLRGGLFDRAAAEFRAALAREPQRLDILIGLAESLWRGGHGEEAVGVCQHILDDSPDCLKALVIAGLIAIAAGKELNETEQDIWQAAYALDPESHLAKELAAEVGEAVPQSWWTGMPSAELPDPEDESLRPELFLPGTAEAEAASIFDISDGVNGSGNRPANGISDWRAGVGGLIETTSLPEIGDLAFGSEAGDEAPPFTPEWGALAGQLDEAHEAQTVPKKSNGAGDQGREPAPASQADQAHSGSGANDRADDGLLIQDDNLSGTIDESPAAKPRDKGFEDSEWGEWAEMLNEDITLDAAAEARLSAALAEMQSIQGRVPSPAEQADPSPQQNGHSHGNGLEALPDDPALAALEPYRKAVTNDPSDPAARVALARAYRDAGKLSEAVAEYHTLIKTAPQLSGDVATALRDLLRAEPNHVEAHRALGDAYMKIGRFQQAIDEYNQALNLEKLKR